MLTKQLQNLGLSEKEAQVYLAALELGETTIQRIAQKTGYKRSTTYSLVHALKEKGLVTTFKSRGRNLYVAEHPQALKKHVAQKAEVVESILPELLSITNVIDKKPVIKYYEGLEQVKSAYFDTLQHKDQEIVGWISGQPFAQVSKSFWYEEYQPKRIEKKIWGRLIVPNISTMKTYASDDAKTLKQSRIDTSDHFNIDSDIILYGQNKVVITSFAELVGLVIESKKIHNMLKAIFESHWKSLEK